MLIRHANITNISLTVLGILEASPDISRKIAIPEKSQMHSEIRKSRFSLRQDHLASHLERLVRTVRLSVASSPSSPKRVSKNAERRTPARASRVRGLLNSAQLKKIWRMSAVNSSAELY